MDMMTDYIYQYDLDGFPISKVQDIANLLKFNKKRLYKICPVCKKNQCLNKPRHKCLNCLLDTYTKNTNMNEFMKIQAKIIVEKK